MPPPSRLQQTLKLDFLVLRKYAVNQKFCILLQPMKHHPKPNAIGQSNPLKTGQNIVCRDQERMFFEAPSIPKIWPVCFHRSGHNSASYNKQILSSYNYTLQYSKYYVPEHLSLVWLQDLQTWIGWREGLPEQGPWRQWLPEEGLWRHRWQEKRQRWPE